jgi:hypothetical protein
MIRPGAQYGVDHVSNLRLDQLITGDLGKGVEEATRAHLGSCADCDARHRALLHDAEVCRADPRLLLAAEDSRTRLDAARHRPSRRPLRFATTTAVVAAAAAAVVLSFGAPRDRLAVRLKGDLAMDVFVRHADAGPMPAIEIALPDQIVHPGDQLRFRVAAPLAGYFGVIAIDPVGAVGAYAPAGEQLVAVPAGARVLLDGAVELDGSLGRERLLGVLCIAPASKAAIARGVSQALAIARTNRAADLDPQRVLPSCTVTSFWLRKAARP